MKSLRILILILLPLAGFAQDWESLNHRALELYREGRYDEAIRLAEQAVKAGEKEFGRVSEACISSTTNKAYAQLYAGYHREALESFKSLFDLSNRLYPLPHVTQMQSMVEISKAYMNLAMYDSAEFYLDIGRNIYLNIPRSNKAHYDTAVVEIFDSSLKLNATEASRPSCTRTARTGHRTFAGTGLLHETGISGRLCYPC